MSISAQSYSDIHRSKAKILKPSFTPRRVPIYEQLGTAANPLERPSTAPAHKILRLPVHAQFQQAVDDAMASMVQRRALQAAENIPRRAMTPVNTKFHPAVFGDGRNPITDGEVPKDYRPTKHLVPDYYAHVQATELRNSMRGRRAVDITDEADSRAGLPSWRSKEREGQPLRRMVQGPLQMQEEEKRPQLRRVIDEVFVGKRDPILGFGVESPPASNAPRQFFAMSRFNGQSWEERPETRRIAHAEPFAVTQSRIFPPENSLPPPPRRVVSPPPDRVKDTIEYRSYGPKIQKTPSRNAERQEYESMIARAHEENARTSQMYNLIRARAEVTSTVMKKFIYDQPNAGSVLTP